MSTSDFLNKISELGQAMNNEREAYEAENDAWWSRLSIKEREDAFYAVVKRIYQGELVDKGSYRYILYNIFGFDASMYIEGMECGFLALHNAIKTDTEEQIIYEYYESRNKTLATVCKHKDAAGNCPLHNLHCSYPKCEKQGEQY